MTRRQARETPHGTRALAPDAALYGRGFARLAIAALLLGYVALGARPALAQVSSVEKELEADRFSGYTLARLGISAANLTAYYSMGGDEFSGVHDHGFSNQRIAAFDLGWKRAEWHQAEDGSATAKSVANSATSDDSGEADDSSVAAVP